MLFTSYLRKVLKLTSLQNLPKHVQVNFTCDGWQASNVDGYFAVTAHWIASVNGTWKLHNAIIGFVQIRNSHNGKRLGGTLYCVLQRLELQKRVCKSQLYNCFD